MKRLTITYGGTVRFDGEVDEITTVENSGSFSVKARLERQQSALSGILGQLAATGRRAAAEQPPSEPQRPPAEECLTPPVEECLIDMANLP